MEEDGTQDDGNGEEEADAGALVRFDAKEEGGGDGGARAGDARQDRKSLDESDDGGSFPVEIAVCQFKAGMFLGAPEDGGIDDEQDADDEDAAQLRFDVIVECETDGACDSGSEDESAEEFKVWFFFLIEFFAAADADGGNLFSVKDADADERSEVESDIESDAQIG